MRTGEKVKTKAYPRRVPKRIAIPAPDVFTRERDTVREPERIEVGNVPNPFVQPATK